MSAYFPEAEAPLAKGCNIYLHIHAHEWTQVGAKQNRNGTWSSVWTCALCPDVATGGTTGPIPAGYCPCGWVGDPAKPCEECGRERIRREKEK